MRSLLRRAVVSVLPVALASSVVLAGCGTTDEPADEPAGSGTPAAAGPVTVTDARGKKLSFDKAPQRIVSLEWGLTEQLVSLGVQPVGVADIKGYNLWVTAAKLDGTNKDVGDRGEPSTDAIGGLRPDLIVAVSDTAGSTITQLERSAPVLVVKPNDVEDPVGHMRDTARLLGKALGRSAAAARVVARFDAGLGKARKALTTAGVAGLPVAVSDGFREGSSVGLRIYSEGSLWGGLLTELGLKEQWPGAGDKSYGLVQTDVEGLTKITNPRTHFVYLQNKTDGGDLYREVLADNPVWQGLPFVKAKRVDRLPDGTWPFGGPLSSLQFVERTTAILTRTA